MGNHLVVFQPSGQRGRVEHGKNLLEVSRELGVDIEAVCGGQQACGKCRIRVYEGSYDRLGIQSHPNHLSRITEKEKKLLTEKDRAENYRLACSSQVVGDLLLYVPEESRTGRQVVRKEVTLRDIELNPAIKTYTLKLEKPSLADPMGDLERLLRGLESHHGIQGLKAGRPVLMGLHRILREAQWEVTVAVWMNREILRVVPGSSMPCFGLALDIGTTTIAGYLCDLGTGQVAATHSLMNPQVTFGEDVMSRLTYIMNHENSLLELHRSVIGAVNEIAANVCTKAAVGPDDILELCVVGNTVMHHIFLNISPLGIGSSPFVPVVHDSLDIEAHELGIDVNRSAKVHVLPIEAGFVGADNVGVLIAEAPYESEEVQLIIDIGTNGEILLGNRERILSASCATGPALEGAHITFGMRAAAGAIERVKISADTLDAEYKVIAGSDGESPRGLCGSGIIDAIAELYRTGIIQRNGTFTKSLENRRILRKGGSTGYVLVPKNETAIGKDITVSLGDIRAVQLAKGAIYGASKLLMKRLGVERVDRVVLAGAFGSYIDRTCAMLMGLFPDCPPENVVSVGNAAGDGARMALLDIDKRREAREYARRVEYLELTLEADFQQEYAEAMYFPHMSDAFPSLAGLLPESS